MIKPIAISQRQSVCKLEIQICELDCKSNTREYSTLEKVFIICGVYHHDIYFANQHD